MCVECGTVLSVSSSPVALQERAFIREQIAAGKDKEQIKAALVEEYGEGVLAEPGRDGFNATLWIVPIVLVLLAAVGIGIAIRRWRGNASDAARGGAAAAAERRGRAAPGRGAGPVTEGADPTVIAAFAVGFVSFISPCVLPLVPGYLSAVSGVSLAEMRSGERSLLEDPAARDRLLPVVHDDLRRARDDRDRPRLDAADQRGTLDKIAGADHHRARRLLPADAVRPAPEPRLAPGRADQPRRLRRPDRRRARRSRSPGRRASARRSARSSTSPRPRTPSARAASCSRSTPPAWPSRSCSPRSPSRA